MGLDKPWYVQYGRYMRSLARFDLGPTFTFEYRTVNSILREQGPVTLELVLLALGWAFLFGVPLGVFAALWSASGGTTNLIKAVRGVPARWLVSFAWRSPSLVLGFGRMIR